MRRQRILAATCIGIALLSLAAFAGNWWYVAWIQAFPTIRIGMAYGGVIVSVDTVGDIRELDAAIRRGHWGDFVWLPRCGGRDHTGFGTASSTDQWVFVPLWMIGGVSGGVGAWLFARRGLSHGHCACGYDLAGLSGVCPECGRKA